MTIESDIKRFKNWRSDAEYCILDVTERGFRNQLRLPKDAPLEYLGIKVRCAKVSRAKRKQALKQAQKREQEAQSDAFQQRCSEGCR